ncbi:MAG: MCE family protein [Deltaproteobacteria bacterium]|nr:MCE family protein [Deltaproteobacteria bacterium]
MREERAIQIRVGLFVLAGLILSAIIIFMLGSERAWFQRKYELRCRFEDTAGLLVGASVHLAGVKVGAVEAIHLPTDPTDRQIDVVLKIGRANQEQIRADSEAAIYTQGLLGDKYIHITLGSPSEAALAPGAYLRTGRIVGLAAVAERGGAVLAEIEKAATEVREFLEDRSRESLIHVLFYDPRGKEIFSDLVAGMRSFSGANLGKIGADLQKAADDIHVITQQIRRGEGTLGGLLTDPAIYNDLRTLFGRANRNLLLRSIVRATLRANERQAVER